MNLCTQIHKEVHLQIHERDTFTDTYTKRGYFYKAPTPQETTALPEPLFDSYLFILIFM